MTNKYLPVCLIAIALGAGIFAAPYQSPQDREAELRTMVSELARAKDRDQWWKDNRQRITKEIADLADDMGDRAASEGRPNSAMAMYGFAAVSYLLLEDRPKALYSMLNNIQIQFMVAETPEAYREVRSAALSLQKKAEDEQAANAAFGFAVLAADSSYFAGEPAGDRGADGDWVATVLADLAPALEKANQNRSAIMLERLVSLTARTIKIATGQYFANQEELDPLLRKVATALDAAIPPDFSYRSNIGDEWKTIATALSLADVSYSYGNAAVASARLATAADRARKIGDTELYLHVIHARYRGERRAGRSPAQLHQLRLDARGVAQEIRQGYRSRAGRIWNAYSFDTAYGEMLKDEFAVEGIDSATAIFAAVEALKARTMLDQLRGPPMELASPEQRTQAAALEKKVLGFAPDDKESENLTLEEMKLVSQLSGFSELAGSEKERAQALAELERLYKAGAAGFRSVATPASLEEAQKALADDEAIIEYVIPYHALHPASDIGILLITKQKCLQVHLDLEKIIPSYGGGTVRIAVDRRAPIDGSPLGDAVIGLRTALRSSNEKVAIEKLGFFHELLIQPLMKRGFQPEKYARLIIAAHGVLQYIPFAALMDSQGVPLIRKTAITMAPSASVWLELQKRGGAVDRWVAFANPKLEAKDKPPLENSAREVGQISDVLGKLQHSVKIGEQASKEQLFALAPGAGILHLATHGEFPNENALDLHGLLLAGETGKDGALRAMEVRRLNLTSMRLVVLSVCNGGLYRMGPTDEPYGLVPAFLLAGSQNVMATLWPLDDQFGRRFTVEFYRNLLQYGPAEAHRRACLRFIDEDELIRRWAGFVIVGAGRPFTGVPERR